MWITINTEIWWSDQGLGITFRTLFGAWSWYWSERTVVITMGRMESVYKRGRSLAPCSWLFQVVMVKYIKVFSVKMKVIHHISISLWGGAIHWDLHSNRTLANVKKFMVSGKEWARATAVKFWPHVALKAVKTWVLNALKTTEVVFFFLISSNQTGCCYRSGLNGLRKSAEHTRCMLSEFSIFRKLTLYNDESLIGLNGQSTFIPDECGSVQVAD